ncbi:MAG: hypothetical protein KVP17_000635 [Porospora cf. gigantea B]|uniref:uncharacterized protein n=1 Tax=Porospora cf. gigantea B TaxID=2853592 RepID=UPI0035719C21|nr:MAG: hypothetical protein KVP17_000635 [Porospora cf. gigantea B]
MSIEEAWDLIDRLEFQAALDVLGQVAPDSPDFPMARVVSAVAESQALPKGQGVARCQQLLDDGVVFDEHTGDLMDRVLTMLGAPDMLSQLGEQLQALPSSCPLIGLGSLLKGSVFGAPFSEAVVEQLTKLQTVALKLTAQQPSMTLKLITVTLCAWTLHLSSNTSPKMLALLIDRFDLNDISLPSDLRETNPGRCAVLRRLCQSLTGVSLTSCLFLGAYDRAIALMQRRADFFDNDDYATILLCLGTYAFNRATLSEESIREVFAPARQEFLSGHVDLSWCRMLVSMLSGLDPALLAQITRRYLTDGGIIALEGVQHEALVTLGLAPRISVLLAMWLEPSWCAGDFEQELLVALLKGVSASTLLTCPPDNYKKLLVASLATEKSSTTAMIELSFGRTIDYDVIDRTGGRLAVLNALLSPTVGETRSALFFRLSQEYTSQALLLAGLELARLGMVTAAVDAYTRLSIKSLQLFSQAWGLQAALINAHAFDLLEAWIPQRREAIGDSLKLTWTAFLANIGGKALDYWSLTRALMTSPFDLWTTGEYFLNALVVGALTSEKPLKQLLDERFPESDRLSWLTGARVGVTLTGCSLQDESAIVQLRPALSVEELVRRRFISFGVFPEGGTMPWEPRPTNQPELDDVPKKLAVVLQKMEAVVTRFGHDDSSDLNIVDRVAVRQQLQACTTTLTAASEDFASADPDTLRSISEQLRLDIMPKVVLGRRGSPSATQEVKLPPTTGFLAAERRAMISRLMCDIQLVDAYLEVHV